MSELRVLSRLRAHAESRGDAVAYQEAGDGRRLTYRALLDETTTAATRLRSSMSPGGVVLIACSNRIELPIAILGAWAAGCIAFPVSSESTAVEIQAAAKASGARVLITDAGEFKLDVEALHEPIIGTRLLLKSSGTTGRPQIVCRNGASLDAVCEQMVAALEMSAGDRTLAVVSLSHSYGIEHGLLMPITAGAAVHLCDGFNLPVAIREIETRAITFLPGVPSMYEMLARIGTTATHWPAMRRAYCAGASLPLSIFESLRRKLDLTVAQLYGATEIGSVTFSDASSNGFDPRSVGPCMNGVDVKIVGIEHDEPLGANREGQLCVRASSMFSGYLDPAGSAKWVDGFFATGDIASTDDAGRITIVGRLSLLIDVGGLKVNPIEIEEVLADHPAVASCVVLPVRQSETVSRIKSVITPRDAAHPPTIESLRQFARERLASYKVPRTFELRESLPRTPTGKILRHLVDA